jgi:hypothetical protein
MRTLRGSDLGLFLVHPCLHPPDHLALILPAIPSKWKFILMERELEPLNRKKQGKFAIFIKLAIIYLAHLVGISGDLFFEVHNIGFTNL